MINYLSKQHDWPTVTKSQSSSRYFWFILFFKKIVTAVILVCKSSGTLFRMCSLVFVLIIIHIYCSAKPILIVFEISYKWKKIHPPLKAEFRKSTWRNPVVHPIIYLFILHRPIRNNKFCWICKKKLFTVQVPMLGLQSLTLKSLLCPVEIIR